MSGKYIAAVAIAVIALSGCSSTSESHTSTSEAVDSSSSSSTTSTSPSTASTTSSNTASTAQGSENSSIETSAGTSSEAQSTSAEDSVPETSSTPTESSVTEPDLTSSPDESSEDPSSAASTTSSETPQQNPPKQDIIAAGETRILSGNKTYFVDSGEVLEVEGTLEIENGSTLKVMKGGELLVNGDVRVDGKLLLSADSKLSMGNSKAMIDGSGSVVVKDSFDQIDCVQGTVKAYIKPPERVVNNGVTTVGGVVIANKAISLPPEFGSHLSYNSVEPEVYAALQEMSTAAGHQFVNRSGFRSYWDQVSTFQSNVELFGYEKADMLSSRAGHSEHQTGLTMDLDSFDQNYGTTTYGKWLAENCWRYGFIIRYPKGKEHITGYEYEPWHVRYLGKSTAKLVFDSGLTLEEFLNVEGGTVVIDP